MMSETKIKIVSSEGDVVIDDFKSNVCNHCLMNYKDNDGVKVECHLDGLDHRRLFSRKKEIGSLQICDNKEKSKNNFLQMAELIWHNTRGLIELQQRVIEEQTKRINDEISIFKHNVETINGESIAEFESVISERRLRSKYKEIVKVVEEAIGRKDKNIPAFIARQALNSLRIQTEILVSRVIGNRYDSKSTDSNPWNPVMANVYLLYPLAQARNVDIKMDPYNEKFNIDYNAIKVASYYILDNAIKYALRGTEIKVSFTEEDSTLVISFSMVSPLILPNETDAIFERGYRGKNAIAVSANGGGFGLFCAKKLLTCANATISVNAGPFSLNRQGIDYAENSFSIVLRKDLQPWKQHEV